MIITHKKITTFIKPSTITKYFHYEIHLCFYMFFGFHKL
jgi:hypothetical protein